MTEHSNPRGIKLGDRVSRAGSWYCGTVTEDWGHACHVEWDGGKDYCSEWGYQFKENLYHTNYYNECWCAVGLRRKGYSTPVPKWEGK